MSLSPDRDHLSALEVFLLRNPELLQKNLELLERDNERLQNLLGWRDHEDIFWKWMVIIQIVLKHGILQVHA